MPFFQDKRVQIVASQFHLEGQGRLGKAQRSLAGTDVEGQGRLGKAQRSLAGTDGDSGITYKVPCKIGTNSELQILASNPKPLNPKPLTPQN